MIRGLFEDLLARYGRQGWWPLLEKTQSGIWECRYHSGEYDKPQHAEERLEICLGAILTQNTNWQNVIKVLIRLKEEGLIEAGRLSKIEIPVLEEMIRPCGYFRQKARKVAEFLRYWEIREGKNPQRGELLKIWGIGPETADSILLYAFKMPVMVIDAYTVRVFSGAGIGSKPYKYEALRQLCEEALGDDYRVLQEFHALLVAEGKNLNHLPDL